MKAARLADRARQMLPVALLLGAGCSRSSADEAPSPILTGSGPQTVLQPERQQPPVGTNSGPVLTPEDVEAETEHRITEQNLESELDRLEREIQGE